MRNKPFKTIQKFKYIKKPNKMMKIKRYKSFNTWVKSQRFSVKQLYKILNTALFFSFIAFFFSVAVLAGGSFSTQSDPKTFIDNDLLFRNYILANSIGVIIWAILVTGLVVGLNLYIRYRKYRKKQLEELDRPLFENEFKDYWL